MHQFSTSVLYHGKVAKPITTHVLLRRNKSLHGTFPSLNWGINQTIDDLWSFMYIYIYNIIYIYYIYTYIHTCVCVCLGLMQPHATRSTTTTTRSDLVPGGWMQVGQFQTMKAWTLSKRSCAWRATDALTVPTRAVKAAHNDMTLQPSWKKFGTLIVYTVIYYDILWYILDILWYTLDMLWQKSWAIAVRRQTPGLVGVFAWCKARRCDRLKAIHAKGQG